MSEEKEKVEVATNVELPVEAKGTATLDVKVTRGKRSSAAKPQDARTQEAIDNNNQAQAEIAEAIKDTVAPAEPEYQFVQLKERLPNNKQPDKYAAELPIGSVCVINDTDYANAVFIVEQINEETKARTGKIATAKEHQFRRL